MSELEVRIESSFSGLDSLQAAWDEAVIALDGSIYMSFDWVRTWWEFYGCNKELRMFLFYSGTRIVGIVPIWIDRIGLGPIHCSIARLVGSNIPPKVFNPPIHPAYAERILSELCHELFATGACDLISLGPISELHPATNLLETAAKNGNLFARACTTVRGVHSIFWLPRSMEEYFASLSKNERKNRRKYELKLLKKEYQASVDVVRSSAQVGKEFDAFAEQHTRYWHAQGKPGHFGAWPRATEFNRALVAAQARLDRVRFIRILANGEAIANQYAFAFGNAYFWELPARATAPQWERFSLGPTGIVTMMSEAVREGMSRLEGGLAHYDYKVRLNAKEYATKTFRIVRNRAGSRLRASLLGALRFCLAICYQKIWYNRLRPHLSAFRYNSHWGAWLRLDF